MSAFMWLIIIFFFSYFSSGLIKNILNIYYLIKQIDKDDNEEVCECKCNKKKLEE